MKERIVIIGDLILDKYLFTSPIKLSPEAPIIVVKKEREEYRLGGGSNVAYNIKQLGGEPLLIGIKGVDKEADILNSLLLEKKIKNLAYDFTNRPTTVKTRILSNNQQVIRIDEEDTTPVDGRFQKLLEGKFKGGINSKEISAIIISDYGKGVITEEVLKFISSFCKEHNIILALDPYTPNTMLYHNSLKKLDLITPNEKQANEMWEEGTYFRDDMRYSPNPSLENISAYLMLKIGNCKNILITRSEKGMFLSYMKEKEFVYFQENAIKTEITDVTGAGDTVIATFVYYLTQGYKPEHCMQYANLAASKVVQHLGTSTVTSNELLKELKIR